MRRILLIPVFACLYYSCAPSKKTIVKNFDVMNVILESVKVHSEDVVFNSASQTEILQKDAVIEAMVKKLNMKFSGKGLRFFSRYEAEVQKIIPDGIVRFSVSDVRIAPPVVTTTTSRNRVQIQVGLNDRRMPVYEYKAAQIDKLTKMYTATGNVSIEITSAETRQSIGEKKYPVTTSWATSSYSATGDSEAIDPGMMAGFASGGISPGYNDIILSLFQSSFFNLIEGITGIIQNSSSSFSFNNHS